MIIVKAQIFVFDVILNAVFTQKSSDLTIWDN